MSTEEKETTVTTIRLGREERQMLKALAGADGVSVSDAMRMAVRRAHEQRFPKPAQKGARR